jgi:hypothetical protein
MVADMMIAENAIAQPPDGARLGLHATVPGKKAGCGQVNDPVDGTPISCRDYNVGPLATGDGVIYHVFLCVAFAPGSVAGMSCGVVYDDTNASQTVVDWTLCADLEFPNSGPNGVWPASGGGNRITWISTTNCQTTEIGQDGVHATAGFFYVYLYGTSELTLMEVTPNNNLVSGPEMNIANCQAQATDLSPLAAAKVGFGTTQGYNPCTVVPVEPTTWGALKRTFGNQ